MTAQILLFAFVVTAAMSCKWPDGCTPNATRCIGHAAEVCDADKNWQQFADCDLVSKQSGVDFVCSAVVEQTEDGEVRGHTCVPAGDVQRGGETQ